MPIYEYYCEDCEKTCEYQQKISDDPMTVCEYCAGPLKKQISLSSFHLKGSGWYVTDYGGKNGPAATNGNGGPNGNGAHPKDEKEKSAEPAKEKTETPKEKPDSKPAPKPASKASS